MATTSTFQGINQSIVLDKHCVRTIIGICGLCYVGLSLAIFILGGQAINNDFLRIIDANQTVFLTMILCGAFLIVTASVGVTAAYSKNQCLAFLFGFMGMSIMLIFIALAIGLLILKSTWTDELNKNCTLKAGLSYQIDQIYSQGADLLCTTSCKCNADPLKWEIQIQFKTEIPTFFKWPEDVRKSIVTDKLGSSQLTDCPMDFLSTYQRDRILPVMKALETQFACAGICEDPKFFLFSQVNQGPPHNNCRDELQDFLAQNVDVYAGFLMAVGLLGMISFGLSFSVCYMRKKGYKPETQLFKFQKTKV